MIYLLACLAFLRSLSPEMMKITIKYLKNISSGVAQRSIHYQVIRASTPSIIIVFVTAPSAHCYICGVERFQYSNSMNNRSGGIRSHFVVDRTVLFFAMIFELFEFLGENISLFPATDHPIFHICVTMR